MQLQGKMQKHTRGQVARGEQRQRERPRRAKTRATTRTRIMHCTRKTKRLRGKRAKWGAPWVWAPAKARKGIL